MSGDPGMSKLGWWLVVSGVVLLPHMAGALDDGGGRSVFAYGAGNRALALGGAYVAVADDASAAVWNPGGLGWVERREFQASHTNLIGLGFSEQYASFVLPSWRWGVAALTFRRFGVDGIEQRDGRNVLLDDDLSDQETELVLAYGRKLGEAWSVGGAVKMQRQSLAGYAGAGYGLDLGLLCQPLKAFGGTGEGAESLTLGLAVRNAVEPGIRLDEESVPDPIALRAGLAYGHPLGGGAVLAALDLEKTTDMNARLHAGLELRFLSYLALRGGSNDGMLAAGSGIRWRDVTLDYMYEDNPLGAVHRFGVAFAFGPTTAESRTADLAAEEAAIQDRLQHVFEARSRERVENLFADAAAARRAGRWDEALEMLGTVKVLDPTFEGIAPLEATCLRQKGLELSEQGDFSGAEVALGRALTLAPDDSLASRGLARVRAESDRRAARSAELRDLFDKALDAFATDDLLTARAGFSRVLEKDPQDPEAAAMLQRTEEAIRHRALNFVEQARILMQAGQLAAADSILTRARVLDGATPGLTEAANLLASARRAAERKPTPSATSVQQAAAPATPMRPVLSPEKQREIEDLYRRGLAAREKGQVDEALRYWEFVWSADPEYQNVAAYLKREYLTRGMESFASGQLQAAMADWEKALRIDPEDQRTIGYLERAREQQAKIQKILGS
jgi:tetratricopeptide (TPR) repeat protein